MASEFTHMVYRQTVAPLYEFNGAIFLLYHIYVSGAFFYIKKYQKTLDKSGLYIYNR